MQTVYCFLSPLLEFSEEPVEVYGIGVFNASKSTIVGNTASSSVKVQLFGAVENQTAVNTLSDQISTVQASQSALQNSLAGLQNQTSNGMYLGYAAIAISVVLGGIAIAISRRKPSPSTKR